MSPLGQHGIVNDAALDSNGRAVYCRDECICSHCEKIMEHLRLAAAERDTMRTCVLLMFVLGLCLAFFSYWLGTGQAPSAPRPGSVTLEEGASITAPRGHSLRIEGGGVYTVGGCAPETCPLTTRVR